MQTSNPQSQTFWLLTSFLISDFWLLTSDSWLLHRCALNHSLICGRLCSKPGPVMMSLCPRPGRITSFLGSPAFLYIETDSSIDTRSSASPWSHIIARGEICWTTDSGRYAISASPEANVISRLHCGY